MSFREQSVLIGLLLLPLAAMADAGMQRRKRADAARFGNPALLPGLATARPGSVTGQCHSHPHTHPVTLGPG